MRLAHRLRGPAIAVAVLAVSATAALGARGLPGTADTDPVPPVVEQVGNEETPAEASPNHGATVSAAAAMETPDGFPNHGAWVSCVAHLAKDDPALDLATVTSELCGVAVVEEESPDVDAALEEVAEEEAEGTEGDATNHGAVVSGAAAMETPDGFRNHGAFVSCVARLAKTDPAFDPATVTPELCDPEPVEVTDASDGADTEASDAGGRGKAKAAKAPKAEHGKAKANGKSQGRGKGRG